MHCKAQPNPSMILGDWLHIFVLYICIWAIQPRVRVAFDSGWQVVAAPCACVSCFQGNNIFTNSMKARIALCFLLSLSFYFWQDDASYFVWISPAVTVSRKAVVQRGSLGTMRWISLPYFRVTVWGSPLPGLFQVKHQSNHSSCIILPH